MSLTRAALANRIDQALGRRRADVVIKGARILNMANGALADETIVSTHVDYDADIVIDRSGAVVVPGLINTHVHGESTCVMPAEFYRCDLPAAPPPRSVTHMKSST